mgnify:CR=1 FL=1
MGLTKNMFPPSYLSEIPLEKRTQAQAWIVVVVVVVVVVIRPTHQKNSPAHITCQIPLKKKKQKYP